MAENTVATEVAAGEGIYLAAAAQLFPPHREGRAVSGSCVFRWCTDGIKLSDGRRVFLGHVRLAGRILTTRGAIKRFLEGESPQPADAATPISRADAANTSARTRGSGAAREVRHLANPPLLDLGNPALGDLGATGVAWYQRHPAS